MCTNYFLSQLKKLQQKHKIIKEVRGKGLMLAAQLNIECGDIVNGCLQRGLLIISAGSKTLRFVPPLIISDEEITVACNKIIEVLDLL